jgi:uncharacterized SAM-binding protein YcdF (DUF218 family)
VVLLGIYLGVCFVQVLTFGRHDQARTVDAIVVMGAANYDGKPSPVLKSRLDHALELWRQKLAPLIVVTGGKQPADRFTEAATSAQYLTAAGVPADAIVQETNGRTSLQELQAVASLLRNRGLRSVLLVSDPYHARRIVGVSGELGLTAWSSPTRTSPEPSSHVGPHYLQETTGLALAHVIGYRHLEWFERLQLAR